MSDQPTKDEGQAGVLVPMPDVNGLRAEVGIHEGSMSIRVVIPVQPVYVTKPVQAVALEEVRRRFGRVLDDVAPVFPRPIITKGTP